LRCLRLRTSFCVALLLAGSIFYYHRTHAQWFRWFAVALYLPGAPRCLVTFTAARASRLLYTLVCAHTLRFTVTAFCCLDCPFHMHLYLPVRRAPFTFFLPFLYLVHAPPGYLLQFTARRITYLPLHRAPPFIKQISGFTSFTTHRRFLAFILLPTPVCGTLLAPCTYRFCCHLRVPAGLHARFLPARLRYLYSRAFIWFVCGLDTRFTHRCFTGFFAVRRFPKRHLPAACSVRYARFVAHSVVDHSPLCYGSGSDFCACRLRNATFPGSLPHGCVLLPTACTPHATPTPLRASLCAFAFAVTRTRTRHFAHGSISQHFGLRWISFARFGSRLFDFRSFTRSFWILTSHSLVLHHRFPPSPLVLRSYCGLVTVCCYAFGWTFSRRCYRVLRSVLFGCRLHCRSL